MTETMQLYTYTGEIDLSEYTTETVEPFMKEGKIKIDTSQMKGGDITTFSSDKITFIIQYIDMSCTARAIYAKKPSAPYTLPLEFYNNS